MTLLLPCDGIGLDRESNKRTRKALGSEGSEDQKATIKQINLASSVVGKATEEKIDVVKSRLSRNHGYNDLHSEGLLGKYLDIRSGGARPSTAATASDARRYQALPPVTIRGGPDRQRHLPAQGRLSPRDYELL